MTIYEVSTEYNYSNPTGFFNISLPHIEAKTTMYQTMSYAQWKKLQLDNERKLAQEAKAKETSEVEEEPQLVDPQESSEKASTVESGE